MGLIRPTLENGSPEHGGVVAESSVSTSSSPSSSSSRRRVQHGLRAADDMKRKHVTDGEESRADCEKRNDEVWEYYPAQASLVCKRQVGWSVKAESVVRGFDTPSTAQQVCTNDRVKKRISPLAGLLSEPNKDGLLYYEEDEVDKSSSPEDEDGSKQEETETKLGGSAPVPIPGASKLRIAESSNSDRPACKKTTTTANGKHRLSINLSPLGPKSASFLPEYWNSARTRMVRSLSLEDDYGYGQQGKTIVSTGLPTRRSLVGSFEESLLSGRFFAGKQCQKLDGFRALLSVTGGSFSPPLRKLPFSVSCVDGDSCRLYYASIDLSGDSSGCKLKESKEESRKARFRVPVRGRIQLVLSNPEMTPVHTFNCSYDLTEMPPGTKTFMRQKVSLASSSHSFTANAMRKRDDESSEVDNDKKIQDTSQVESLGFVVGKAGAKARKEPKTLQAAAKKRQQQQQQQASEATVLRYALHLRFMCPPLKKNEQLKKNAGEEAEGARGDQINGSSSSNSGASSDKRRFYLYGDLRVVFPQRQSDSDEGKLQVEYDFPSDPKYFEYES